MFALAALWTSVRLAVTNEVTVIRAAGTSGATAFAAPILVAFLLGGFWVAVINPLGAAMTKKRHELVSELTGSRNEVFLESSGFFWFRQILDGQQTVLRASSTSRGLEFKDLHVFVFDSTETPVTRIYAEHGRLLDDLTEVSPQSVFGSSAEADPGPGSLRRKTTSNGTSGTTEPTRNRPPSVRMRRVLPPNSRPNRFWTVSTRPS